MYTVTIEEYSSRTIKKAENAEEEIGIFYNYDDALEAAKDLCIEFTDDIEEAENFLRDKGSYIFVIDRDDEDTRYIRISIEE